MPRSLGSKPSIWQTESKCALANPEAYLLTS